jgi:hypothetical protein
MELKTTTAEPIESDTHTPKPRNYQWAGDTLDELAKALSKTKTISYTQALNEILAERPGLAALYGGTE